MATGALGQAGGGGIGSCRRALCRRRGSSAGHGLGKVAAVLGAKHRVALQKLRLDSLCVVEVAFLKQRADHRHSGFTEDVLVRESLEEARGDSGFREHATEGLVLLAHPFAPRPHHAVAHVLALAQQVEQALALSAEVVLARAQVLRPPSRDEVLVRVHLNEAQGNAEEGPHVALGAAELGVVPDQLEAFPNLWQWQRPRPAGVVAAPAAELFRPAADDGGDARP
mmetsp:Transcript_14905/g.44946  ORF Transcript_14905/g.44946 Transcript_14905/m.44946 type:complete len:225 (+) Transcript_14905:961-1635(+)